MVWWLLSHQLGVVLADLAPTSCCGEPGPPVGVGESGPISWSGGSRPTSWCGPTGEDGDGSHQRLDPESEYWSNLPNQQKGCAPYIPKFGQYLMYLTADPEVTSRLSWQKTTGLNNTITPQCVHCCAVVKMTVKLPAVKMSLKLPGELPQPRGGGQNPWRCIASTGAKQIFVGWSPPDQTWIHLDPLQNVSPDCDSPRVKPIRCDSVIMNFVLSIENILLSSFKSSVNFGPLKEE